MKTYKGISVLFLLVVAFQAHSQREFNFLTYSNGNQELIKANTNEDFTPDMDQEEVLEKKEKGIAAIAYHRAFDREITRWEDSFFEPSRIEYQRKNILLNNRLSVD